MSNGSHSQRNFTRTNLKVENTTPENQWKFLSTLRDSSIYAYVFNVKVLEDLLFPVGFSCYIANMHDFFYLLGKFLIQFSFLSLLSFKLIITHLVTFLFRLFFLNIYAYFSFIVFVLFAFFPSNFNTYALNNFFSTAVYTCPTTVCL